MTHDEERAIERRELRFQQLERLDVQVVRRFVQDEDVGGPGQQSRQQQPAAFAARERLHRRTGALRGKQEILQIAVDVTSDAADRHGVVAVSDGIHHTALGIERLALLVEVHDLDVRPAPHFALVRLQGRQ